MDSRNKESSGSNRKRTTRFVKQDNGWYFRTREEILVGPFPTQFDAELSASLLIARLSQLEQVDESPQVIRSFITDSVKSDAAKNREPLVIDWEAIRKTAKRDRLNAIATRLYEELTRNRSLLPKRG